jgi:Slx4 endonuclease
MISILEDCWKATQQPVKQHLLPPETPVSSSLPIDLSSPAILRRVQARIFQTIKTDPDQGVYCGILRYEPVVIEELVAWLKERGVDIPELVVRGWCDKEGICCVGADSLKGGRRARY